MTTRSWGAAVGLAAVSALFVAPPTEAAPQATAPARLYLYTATCEPGKLPTYVIDVVSRASRANEVCVAVGADARDHAMVGRRYPEIYRSPQRAATRLSRSAGDVTGRFYFEAYVPGLDGPVDAAAVVDAFVSVAINGTTVGWVEVKGAVAPGQPLVVDFRKQLPPVLRGRVASKVAVRIDWTNAAGLPYLSQVDPRSYLDLPRSR